MHSTKAIQRRRVLWPYATKRRPYVGGWAATLVSGKHQRIQYGYIQCPSEFRAELLAVVTGLQALKKRSYVIVRTASDHLMNGIPSLLGQRSKGKDWVFDVKNGKAKNSDLWQELLTLSQLHEIQMEWIAFRSKDGFTQDAFRSASQAARWQISRDFRPATNGSRNYV